MKSLLLRGVTGTVFVGVLLAAILYNNITFGALFLIVAGLAVNEFCTLVHACKKTTFSTYVAVLGGMYLFFMLWAAHNMDTVGMRQLILPYIILVVYVFVNELFRNSGSALDNLAYFSLSQVYAALPFALLNVLATFGDGEYSYVLPLAVFVFLWSNDTGAFCVGCSIGRHKMFERVSPKKSWEGFVGGAVTAILAGYIMSRYFDVLATWEWMTMAAVVVAAGTLGDLIESCMKREMGIKDSGNILPGHGGILDRFDSMILAVPTVVVFLYIIS